MVMDYLNRCYFSRVRLFRDSDQEAVVRWFYAPEGAKLFPEWHLFGSEVWNVDHTQPDPPIGERRGKKPWSNGVNPGYVGQCFRGERDWYSAGVPAAALDEPVAPMDPCCRVTRPGGVALDGGAEVAYGTTIAGGLALDGAAAAIYPAIAGTGGIAFNGAAGLGFSLTFRGGLLFDGAGLVVQQLRGTGGMLLDGAAPLTWQQRSTAAGGLVVDGAAAHGWGQLSAAAGGLFLDGAAVVSYSITAPAAGGLVVDGTAPRSWSLPITGRGGLLLDGVAHFITKTQIPAGRGGLLLDGRAAFTSSTVTAAAGGLLLDGAAGVMATLLPHGGVLLDGTGQFSYAGGIPLPTYDLLSALSHAIVGLNNPSGQVLAASWMHQVTVTAASSAKLPPPVAGNLVGVKIDPASTQLFTLAPNGSESIDGGTGGRIMWAGESAILLSDGVNWFKIAGRTIPMHARVLRQTTLGWQGGSLPAGVWMTLYHNVAREDNTGLMSDGQGITIRRPGTYLAGHAFMLNQVNSANLAGSRLVRDAYILATPGESGASNGWYPYCAATVAAAFAAGAKLTVIGFQNSNAPTDIIANTTDDRNFLFATEQPSW